MRIFHNVTEADRRLWKAPLVSQLFPFLWAEPHHADVSLFCEDRSWQNDFSNSRSRITAWVARFLLKRSWRTVPVARYLTNVSVCFIQLSKNDWKKKIVFPIYRVGKEEKRNQNPKLFPLLVQMERFILAINGWFSPFSLLSVQQTSIC